MNSSEIVDECYARVKIAKESERERCLKILTELAYQYQNISEENDRGERTIANAQAVACRYAIELIRTL